jgi:predicted N-formylglutamate amidohydrolase
MPDTEVFQPVETVAGDGRSRVVVLVDHASNRLPAAYGTLGLPQAQLDRHIGYDIGALSIGQSLARRLRGALVASRFSRLLIDPNRGIDDPTLVMRVSDGAVVPANARVDADEIAFRIKAFHQPYHAAVAHAVAAVAARGAVPVLVSVHTFTPVWRGRPRPWHVGLLWDADPRMAQSLVARLSAAGDLVVGDNEPYDGALEGDTVWTHATTAGYPNALLEIRQDLVATPEAAAAWGERLAEAIEPLLEDPATSQVKRYGSRTGRPFFPAMASGDVRTSA